MVLLLVVVVVVVVVLVVPVLRRVSNRSPGSPGGGVCTAVFNPDPIHLVNKSGKPRDMRVPLRIDLLV